MFIKKLKITNFKNHESGEVQFTNGFNIIVGLNGMGKTNLLDAIYYLCIGKSYFTPRDLNVVTMGNSFFRLEGQFSRENNPVVIIAKVVPGKTKEILKNGKTYDRMGEHIGFLPVVIISPRDIQLFYEGSVERRKFLDYSISQYDREYLRQLTDYNKLLKQRNILLKQFTRDQSFDGQLLDTYSEKMSGPAAYICKMRKSFVEELSPIFNNCYRLISNDSEKCICSYDTDLETTGLISLHKINQQKDRILQRTTTGIHKDDLNFEINGLNLKTFGSQGQLKTFVLALKLAQYEMLNQHTSIKPILLLDDLFDKLDNQRVNHLLQLLNGEDFGQVFISDTHEIKLRKIFSESNIKYSCFNIENGTILS